MEVMGEAATVPIQIVGAALIQQYPTALASQIYLDEVKEALCLIAVSTRME
jgi:hypothetical protein